MPGRFSTMEILRPAILLKKVDLPTFGLPTTATMGFAIISPDYSVGIVIGSKLLEKAAADAACDAYSFAEFFR